MSLVVNNPSVYLAQWMFLGEESLWNLDANIKHDNTILCLVHGKPWAFLGNLDFNLFKYTNVAIKVPVYTFVYLTNLVKKVINEGNGLSLTTLESWHGKIWRVETTNLWIISWETGVLKKILRAFKSRDETMIMYKWIDYKCKKQVQRDQVVWVIVLQSILPFTGFSSLYILSRLFITGDFLNRHNWKRATP